MTIPHGEARFFVKGDVSVVLNGEVRPQETPTLTLGDIPFALGAGAYSDPSFFGETLVLNHIAWGATVQGDHLKLERAAPALVSPFLMGIEIKKEPPLLVHYNNLSAIEIFEELLPHFKLGYAFVADALFGLFEGAYLKKSPIYGQNVNVHQQEYWQRDGAQENVQAFLFGIVLTEAGKKHPDYAKGFYHNPNETHTTPLSSHTHAALCEEHPLPTTFEELNKLLQNRTIKTVRHFLTQSVIKQGRFALFNLN